MNLDRNKEICVCNSLTLGEIVDFVKANNIKSITKLIDNDELPMGDKCESCHEDGYNNDGYSLAMILSLVDQGRL
ncbi:MAG TPA: (2Fe-2S)-binding protein [Helicobacteraceae bacterium]|nr:(2Fe-2S)-binding protein [Helicobacteraceae bacterium]